MFAWFHRILDLSCGECNVISLYFLYFSVNLSVSLVCLTVFVTYLRKQFPIFLGVVVILLLNVMELLSLLGGALFDISYGLPIVCLLCL